MSRKPPKKSDADKSWMRARKGRERQIAPEYHLIVTEGTKTEPNYFNALKDHVNGGGWRKRLPVGDSERIHFKIEGTGKNTVGVFERACELAEEFKQKEGRTYDHVWVVYDKDDFPTENFNVVVDSCKSASNRKTAYHALWSNQCIELWFLLHFEYSDTDIPRESYITKLTAHYTAKELATGAYKKNSKDTFDILRPYLNVGIRNAKKLRGCYRSKATPAECVPATAVYELLEKLRPYL